MDRLAIDVGPVYPITILSHQPYLVDTDRGKAHCVLITHAGKELEWLIAAKAFEQLQSLLGSASWAGRAVKLNKVQEGKYTRILVALDASPPPSVAPPSPAPTYPVASLPPTESPSVGAGTVRHVTVHEQPYSLEVTRGQRGGYGYTLKIRSPQIVELFDDLNQIFTLLRMTLKDQEALDKGAPANGDSQLTHQ